VEYFVKPVSKDRLLEVIHKARVVAGKEVQKVLVVDDEQLTVEYLTSTIQSAGFQVISAAGGREGLELALQHRPDLIILDLIMPEVSGFQVVQQLRARPETREIRPDLHSERLDRRRAPFADPERASHRSQVGQGRFASRTEAAGAAHGPKGESQAGSPTPQ